METIVIDRDLIDRCPAIHYDSVKGFGFNRFSSNSIRIFLQCMDILCSLNTEHVSADVYRLLGHFIVDLLGSTRTEKRTKTCLEAVALLDAFNFRGLRLAGGLYQSLLMF
jgi:hypothetical protein